MKKFLALFTTMVYLGVCPIAGSTAIARAEGKGRQVFSRQTAVVDGQVYEIRLSGVGTTYKKQIKIDVFEADKNPAKPVCSLTPTRDYGFDPSVNLYDFVAGEPFIFYSAQSGGSGGYGFYYVYRLKGGTCALVYDDETDSRENRFSGGFIDGCKMSLRNENQKSSLIVDVSYMAADFLNQIFTADCKPKGEEVNINDISVVFPYFNAAVGYYQLMTNRSVTAVAEVNRLGYITENLDFSENAFKPYFVNFSISF